MDKIKKIMKIIEKSLKEHKVWFELSYECELDIATKILKFLKVD